LRGRMCGPLVLHKSNPKSSDTNYARPNSNCTKKPLPFVGVGAEYIQRGRERNRRRHQDPAHLTLDTTEGGLLRRQNRGYSKDSSSGHPCWIAVFGLISVNQREQTTASRVYQSGAICVALPWHRGLDSATKMQIGSRLPRSSSYVLE
jgi:hypothetical protein